MSTEPRSPDDSRRVDRRLWASAFLNTAVTIAELAGGFLAGSLALLADALHNLSDVATLALAIVARRVGRRPPSLRFTYGLKRVEVFAALVNAVVLLAVIGVISREAVRRLLAPQPVGAGVMLVVALFALVANIVSVLLLRGPGRDDLNIRSAALHLLQDALASVAVVLAALFAHTPVGLYLDPVASLVVSFAVLRSALSIVWEVFGMLAEGVPRGVDLEELARSVERRITPARLHHLHVWEVGPGQRALTAHLSVPEMSVAAVERLCLAIRQFLFDEWQIAHVTLEPEVRGCGEAGLLGEATDTGDCGWGAGRPAGGQS